MDTTLERAMDRRPHERSVMYQSPMDGAASVIFKLRAQVTRLEDQVAQLKAGALSQDFPPGFMGLTRQQRLIVRALYKARGGVVQSSRLMVLAEVGGTSGKALHTQVCWARQTLKNYDPRSDIENEHGEGYRLNPHAVALCDSLFANSGGDHVSRAS